MAIGANKSEQVVVTGRSLWTGLANLKVLLINPTMEEMKKAGQNPQQEPEYTTVETTTEGVEIHKTRVDFHLYDPSKKIEAKRAFWLESKPRLNKNGDKAEWINMYGNTAWTKAGEPMDQPPTYDWFKKEGARPALVGEGKLAKFVQAWANTDTNKDQAVLDDPMAVAKGDIKELKLLFSIIPNNEAQCLLGVKDGKYQDVYDGYFGRPYQKNYEGWRNELKKDGSEFKSNYQGSLELKQYIASSEIEQDKPTDMSAPPSGSGSPSGSGQGGATGGYKF